MNEALNLWLPCVMELAIKVMIPVTVQLTRRSLIMTISCLNKEHTRRLTPLYSQQCYSGSRGRKVSSLLRSGGLRLQGHMRKTSEVLSHL